MANIDKPCSVFNAFNFKRDVEDRIGHIVSLKIGDKALNADIELKKPTDEAAQKVVGPLATLSWSGGYAEPIQISFNVSITNKNEVAVLLNTQMKSVVIEFCFCIYEYDREAKKYFLAMHSNDAVLKGIIQTNGSERVFFLSDYPGGEVKKPENYQVTIGIVPEDAQQDVHMAVSESQKFVKPWGVTRGGEMYRRSAMSRFVCPNARS